MAFLQSAANKGSLPTGPHEITNSCKFERGSNEAIETTNAAVGNKKTWTFSAWIKRTELGKDYHCLFGAGYTNIHFMDNDRLRAVFYDGSTSYYADTFAVFRDMSAWYHIVVSCDTTDGTRIQAVKMYINGVRVSTDGTGFSNSSFNNMPQNTDTGIGYAGSDGSERWLRLGRFFSGDEGFSGYMADVHYVNGTARAADQFGEFDDNGIWIPKKYLGGYGTQGFRYEFKDASALGTDSGSEGHNANGVSNITAADQSTDTPTNNFCTWNPLWAFYRNSTITEGGTVVAGAAGGWSHAGATMGVTNGRWYWEWKVTTTENGFISFSTLEGNLNLNQLGHDNSVIMGYQAGNLYTWLNGVQGSTENTGWGTWAVNDIIGIFLDVENSDRRFTLYKNGSAISGNTSFPVSFPNAMQTANGGGNIFPYNVQYENDGGQWNFGGYTTMSNSTSYNDANGYGSFVYNPVLGGVNYYAICTKNLAEYG